MPLGDVIVSRLSPNRFPLNEERQTPLSDHPIGAEGESICAPGTEIRGGPNSRDLCFQRGVLSPDFKRGAHGNAPGSGPPRVDNPTRGAEPVPQCRCGKAEGWSSQDTERRSVSRKSGRTDWSIQTDGQEQLIADHSGNARILKSVSPEELEGPPSASPTRPTAYAPPASMVIRPAPHRGRDRKCQLPDLLDGEGVVRHCLAEPPGRVARRDEDSGGGEAILSGGWAWNRDQRTAQESQTNARPARDGCHGITEG